MKNETVNDYNRVNQEYYLPCMDSQLQIGAEQQND